MKRTILLMATSFLIASSLRAVPLTWHFFGTTSFHNDDPNAIPIAQGLNFELRIFLDTNLAGVKFDAEPLSIFFFGPFQGEVEIETLGVLPVNQFADVSYFVPFPSGLARGVEFGEYGLPSIGPILFDSPISDDSTHLGPIAPTAPNEFNSVVFVGPNGLFAGGPVNTFSATIVPEDGSTALLLTSALVALGSLLWRIKVPLARFVSIQLDHTAIMGP